MLLQTKAISPAQNFGTSYLSRYCCLYEQIHVEHDMLRGTQGAEELIFILGDFSGELLKEASLDQCM